MKKSSHFFFSSSLICLKLLPTTRPPMQLPCEKCKISWSLEPLTLYFNSLLFCAFAIILMFDLTQNPRAHLGLPQGTAVCYHYPLTHVLGLWNNTGQKYILLSLSCYFCLCVWVDLQRFRGVRIKCSIITFGAFRQDDLYSTESCIHFWPSCVKCLALQGCCDLTHCLLSVNLDMRREQVIIYSLNSFFFFFLMRS